MNGQQRSARAVQPVPSDETGSPQPERPRVVDPWPRGVSRTATMRISDVLAELRVEFPAVSPSKLRFLEEQGLVSPMRTPAGYRHYSRADVERLRYVLQQQRDRYLPLRVIREQLAELDRGDEEHAPAPARLVAEDGELRALSLAGRHTIESLAQEAGASQAMVAALVDAGVIRADRSGSYDMWARQIVVLARSLAEHGIDARHLRSLRAAVDRQVDLIGQVVAPIRSQHGSSAQERAASVATEVGELLVQLHTALLRSGVADIV